jgi:uncharacterized membrane protein
MENNERKRPESSIKRIGGYLHRVVPVVDSAGKAIHYAITPLMVEFKPRDLMQVIVGASILAVPVAFTEETWNLGAKLPLRNVLALSGISVLFIGLFVYFNFYRGMFLGNVLNYVKRVIAIYVLSAFVVGVLLSLIQQCPWGVDNVLAMKRILIVAFPASMSAAISDTLK